jgi:hypothetical protein
MLKEVATGILIFAALAYVGFWSIRHKIFWWRREFENCIFNGPRQLQFDMDEDRAR